MRALWILLLLAGCSAPAQEVPEATPQVITDPTDFAYDPSAEHVHDYWRGQQRLVVMDGPHEGLGPGLVGGDDVVVHEYRPASGNVVAQGAARLEVTLTWQDAPLDRYRGPSLWVKTPADRAPWKVADIASGQTVALELNETHWDLPHQLLSAWAFQLRMDEDGILRFKGDSRILVEAERGLPIPTYPAHPDHWQGRTSIVLMDERHELFYAHDPGDGGCDGFSCQKVHVPADGLLVPHNATLVEAVLELEGEALFDLGLQYHGGEGRAYQRPPAQGDAYAMDPAGAADGPYAQQSLWEFMAFIEAPLQDGAAKQAYHLTVTVHR